MLGPDYERPSISVLYLVLWWWWRPWIGNMRPWPHIALLVVEAAIFWDFQRKSHNLVVAARNDARTEDFRVAEICRRQADCTVRFHAHGRRKSERLCEVESAVALEGAAQRRPWRAQPDTPSVARTCCSSSRGARYERLSAV